MLFCVNFRDIILILLGQNNIIFLTYLQGDINIIFVGYNALIYFIFLFSQCDGGRCWKSNLNTKENKTNIEIVNALRIYVW